MVKPLLARALLTWTQDDVDFTRYMAENFAAFEYKTQEEVITVIKDLTVVLSTDGTRLLEVISPAHLLSHLRGPAASADAMEVDPAQGEQRWCVLPPS